MYIYAIPGKGIFYIWQITSILSMPGIFPAAIKKYDMKFQ